MLHLSRLVSVSLSHFFLSLGSLLAKLDFVSYGGSQPHLISLSNLDPRSI